MHAADDLRTQDRGAEGIGALVVRDRKAVEAIIHGGGQQFGIRPGTENAAGAVALGRAVELAAREQVAEAARLERLRDRLLDGLRAAVPDLVVTAEHGPRAPHILGICVPGADSEALLMHLDLAGIAVSGGSACSTGAIEPSHVLTALGVLEISRSVPCASASATRRPTQTSTAPPRCFPPSSRRCASSRESWAVREKVLVAMSGGVDSSVAAARLVEQGYDVVGATMKLFCYGEEVPDRPCCSLDSISDARDVAHALDPPLRPQPRGPLQPSRHSELRGRVCPRPHADPVRPLQLVHQVSAPPACRCAGLRLHRDGPLRHRSERRVYRGRDRAKDQSYFLWGIDRAVVARMLTPVGDLSKVETRGLARRLGLVTAEKEESVEICFVPDDDYAAVLERHLAGRRPGALAGAAGDDRWRRHRRAWWLCALHDRPAQGRAGRGPLAPLRRRDSARDARGRCRQ